MCKINLRNRLDVFLKKKFVETFLSGDSEHEFWKRLYLNAIYYRNRFKEPRDLTQIKTALRKDGEANFLSNFYNLIRSVEKDGYDQRFKVPVNTSGKLLNGSHRLAVSMALGLETKDLLICRGDPFTAADWGYFWFDSFGFPKHALNHLVSEMITYHARSSILLIDFRDEGVPSEIVSVTSDFSRIPIDVGSFDLFRLIKLIYDVHGAYITPSEINRKCNRINKYVNIFLIPMSTFNISCLKKKIRQRYHKTEQYTICHSVDDDIEIKLIANLFFRPLGSEFSTSQIVNNLDYRKYMSAVGGLDYADYAITGGSVIELLGLKTAGDVDLVIPTSDRCSHSAYRVSESVDVISKNYLYGRVKGFEEITDDKLLEDPQLSEQVGPFKFVKPSIVISRKLTDQRPKDLRDISKYYSLIKSKSKVTYKQVIKSRLRGAILNFLQRSRFYKYLVKLEFAKRIFIRMLY